jgi:hypothetical protein
LHYAAAVHATIINPLLQWEVSTMRIRSGILILAAFLSLSLTPLARSEDRAAMAGWEKGSPYNSLYDATELDKLRAFVTEIREVVPLPGMSPAIALVVQESEGDEILVHLCPAWFADRTAIGVRKGDKVKIKGAWAEIDGSDVFMASKVKKGDFFEFKVRLTKDGTPFWTMTPEELARERGEQ